MVKKMDENQRNKRLDELSMVGFELDDVCSEIWLTLLAYKRLRFNVLHNRLKQFGTNVSKPTLLEHLKHMIERKLVERKEEGFQNVTYGVTEEIYSLLQTSPEDIRQWYEDLENDKKLPKFLRSTEFDQEKYYRDMSEEDLRKEIEREINYTNALNLHELKNFIQYDLKLDKMESDADFWKLVGNPFYRMHEKSVAMKCRASERYKKKLFETMDIRRNELSGEGNHIRKP